MPVGSDVNYETKKSILDSIAYQHSLSLVFPLNYFVEFDLTDTISVMENCNQIVADLTLERPSCYYELALAQSFGQRVTLLAETGTPIHQAANRNQVLFYSDMSEYECVLRSAIASLD